jgi:hypothetical protein
LHFSAITIWERKSVPTACSIHNKRKCGEYYFKLVVSHHMLVQLMTFHFSHLNRIAQTMKPYLAHPVTQNGFDLINSVDACHGWRRGLWIKSLCSFKRVTIKFLSIHFVQESFAFKLCGSAVLNMSRVTQW